MWLSCFSLSDLANCEDGEVRFLGTSESDGVVLVCYKRRWGTICNSQSDENQQTVCTQMGYTQGELQNHYFYDIIVFVLLMTGYMKYYGVDERPRVPVRLSSMSCNGEETRVFDCIYQTSNKSQVCSDPLSIWCYSGELRVSP